MLNEFEKNTIYFTHSHTLTHSGWVIPPQFPGHFPRFSGHLAQLPGDLGFPRLIRHQVKHFFFDFRNFPGS
jgi:hypothetical protein